MTNVTQRMSAKNKRFWDLPRAQKRVAIAKDVVRQILSEKLEVKAGLFYLTVKKGPNDEMQNEKLDTFLAEQNTCQVCALGACLVGLVNLGDKLRIGDIFKPRDGIGDEYKITEQLRKLFSRVQLGWIEAAFEYRLGYIGIPTAKALAFGSKYEEDSERLIAIMENIIQNRGTFKP